MKIVVIGRGKVGSALGRGWTASGHEVVYAVRNASARPDDVPIAGSAALADIVVLATPWTGTPAAIAAAGDLAGKTVIDCTNPIDIRDGRLALTHGHLTSGAEHLAALAPGAVFFKALNQTGEENLAHPSAYDHKPVMFVAGDDPERKAVVLRLVEDLGFDAADGGPLRNARLLEPLAALWIDQAILRGEGRRFAFARLRPSS